MKRRNYPHVSHRHGLRSQPERAADLQFEHAMEAELAAVLACNWDSIGMTEAIEHVRRSEWETFRRMRLTPQQIVEAYVSEFGVAVAERCGDA